MFSTADLCDEFADSLAVVSLDFMSFGGTQAFFGPIATVKVFEDNVLVRAALTQPGQGRVLVIDGGASRRCALLGDRLAALATENGWAGVVVYGCVRDSASLASFRLGVLALGKSPMRSVRRGEGQQDLDVVFGGVRFTPGHYLYADPDGIVVAQRSLHKAS